MNAIPTQNDIKGIVDAIVASTSVTTQIIDTTLKSIGEIVSRNKLSTNLKGLKTVEEMVVSYKDIVNNIITTICHNDSADGKDLSALLGRVTEYDPTKKQSVTKYTVVDSAMQLTTVVDGMLNIFKKIGNFKLGFLGMRRLRSNILLFKNVLGVIVDDMIGIFSGLMSQGDIDKIIGSLVKQPDTIERIEELNKDGNKLNNYSIQETKKGRLGLLDVFEKVFSIVGMLNKLKVPNLVMLKVKMMLIKIGLTSVTNNLIDWANTVITPDKEVALTRLENTLVGKKGNGGVHGIVNALTAVIDSIRRIKFTRKDRRILKYALKGLQTIINGLVDLRASFSKLGRANLIKAIKKANQTIDLIVATFENTRKLIGNGILIIMFMPVIRLAVVAIGHFIDTVNKQLSGKKLKDITVLDQLVDITKHLRDISVNLVITGLLAIPAMLAMLIILPFVGILGLFVVGLYTLSTLIEIVADATRDNLGSINKLILSLMLVGVAILLFALATPIIVWAIEDNVLPFILILAGAIAIIFIMSFIARFMAKFAQDNMLQASISLIIIMGSLIVAAMVMLVAAGVGAILRNTDSVLNIIIMIGGMIAISAIAVGLGIALSFASPYISWALAGLAPLVGLLALIMVTGLTIVGLSKLKFDIGTYKPGKDYASGDIGSGEGIIGNVGLIMGFVKFLTSKLSDFERKDIKKMRQSKRLMKQVSKTTKQIVKIADSLNRLKDIKLDQDKILANVSTIFAFIRDLETKIQDFMKPEGLKENDGTIKTAVTNIFKQAVNGIRKRQEMRQANRTLNKVEKVVTTLNNIGEAMVSVSELKMTDEFKTLITNNVESIFTFIKELDAHIAAFMVADVNPDDVVDAQKLSKKEWKKANKKLSKVESTIATLQGIGEALNTIKDLKFDDKTQATIKTNVELALGSVETIAGIITGKTNSIKIDEDEIEKLNPLIDYITALNNGFKGIDGADPVKVEKNINNYIRFVDKVNSVQVEKVQKTAQMFEQMSKFSSSIKGDFDKLAESLSEKLLPVLEELKEVMGVLPEKIDNGFQNTSASIAAVNAAPTTENVTAQVNRENPNLTKEQVDAMVKTRINEKAQADANGMNAKLDELISLLKGFGGENVVVRTI